MNRIDVERKDFINCPLWFHKKNLRQTSTGYGANLATPYKIKYNNRLHRVYLFNFSNSGTLYIKTKNGDVIVNEI